MAVLDCEATLESDIDHLKLQISQASVTVLKSMMDIQWDVQNEDANDPAEVGAGEEAKGAKATSARHTKAVGRLKKAQKDVKVRFVPTFLKKTGPEPKTIPALPENFRKNEKGRQLIRQEVAKLVELDLNIDPSKASFDAESGMCRLSRNPLIDQFSVQSFILQSPSYFELHTPAKSVQEWGKSVHEELSRCSQGIAEHQRKPWHNLIKSVFHGTMGQIQ